jgi:hypothetical protein
MASFNNDINAPYDDSIPFLEAELINAGAVVDKPTPKLPDVKLCSGLGAYHSDNHETNPKPYLTVSLTDIEQLVKHPQNVKKSQGQWAILSTLLSRESVKQHENGIFHAVWLDIDVHTEKHAIQAFLADLGVFYYWLYSTKSSTETKQKWRVIIPLFSPASCFQFKTISEILNDKLAAAGIVPDRASERPNQVCYLPNKGEYYDFHIEHAPLFNWQTTLAKEIKDKAQKERLRLEESNRLREQSRQRAIERMATGASSPIEAYNAAYDVEKNLKHYGYKKDGNKWLSPNSESGNAGVTVKDNHWFSSHASDYGIGQATSGGCHGDSFDLFVWYEHKGNRNAAIKAAGDMFTVSNGETFTQANQAAFREQKQKSRDYIDYSTMPEFPPMDGVTTDKPKPETSETDNTNKGYTNNDDPYLNNCPDFPPMDDSIDYSTMPEPPAIGEPSKEPPISSGRAQKRKELEQLRTEHDRKPLFTSIGALIAKPSPTDWLIKDYFERDKTVLLFGISGGGKTFITVDMGLSIATGKDWQGHATKQGAVFYICGEGKSGIKKRCLAWSIKNDIQLDNTPFFVSDGALTLPSKDSIERLHKDIEKSGHTPALIIFDTLARCLDGDENVAKDAGAFIQSIDSIRTTYNCTILIVHHCGKDETRGARGSSAIKAAVDTEIMLTNPTKGGFTLSVSKQKDHEHPKDKSFSFESIATNWLDDDMNVIYSAVLVSLENVHEKKARKLNANTQKMLNALMTITKQGIEPPEQVKSLFFDSPEKCPDKVVTVNEWQAAACEVMTVVSKTDDDEQKNEQNKKDALRMAFKRGLERLESDGYIGLQGDFVWNAYADF